MKNKRESHCYRAQSRTMRCFLWKKQITVSQPETEGSGNATKSGKSLFSTMWPKQKTLGVFRSSQSTLREFSFCKLSAIITCGSVPEK